MSVFVAPRCSKCIYIFSFAWFRYRYFRVDMTTNVPFILSNCFRLLCYIFYTTNSARGIVSKPVFKFNVQIVCLCLYQLRSAATVCTACVIVTYCWCLRLSAKIFWQKGFARRSVYLHAFSFFRNCIFVFLKYFMLNCLRMPCLHPRVWTKCTTKNANVCTAMLSVSVISVNDYIRQYLFMSTIVFSFRLYLF